VRIIVHQQQRELLSISKIGNQQQRSSAAEDMGLYYYRRNNLIPQCQAEDQQTNG